MHHNQVDHQSEIFAEIMRIFEDRYGEELDRFLVPPPVFIELGGEFLNLDLEQNLLIARFPIDKRFLNPYGVLQGGMIAAAIDNTLGPLSMLVAPPNLTRKLDIKFSRPAAIEDEFLLAEAKLIEKDGRRLYFTADARNPDNKLLARAKALHWIVEE
jgi:acyl-coenzyme A thioesterase PaaI-like protein